jgi:hypothetical protein
MQDLLMAATFPYEQLQARLKSMSGDHRTHQTAEKVENSAIFFKRYKWGCKVKAPVIRLTLNYSAAIIPKFWLQTDKIRRLTPN